MPGLKLLTNSDTIGSTQVADAEPRRSPLGSVVKIQLKDRGGPQTCLVKLLKTLLAENLSELKQIETGKCVRCFVLSQAFDRPVIVHFKLLKD